MTSRVRRKPSARAGTTAEGSRNVKVEAAFATAVSIAASVASTPAGAVRPSCLKSPAYVVSRPSQIEFSLSGAVTRDAVRT